MVLFMHLWSEFSSTEEGADSAKEKDEDLIKGAVVCFERFKNWRTSVTRKIAQQSLQTIDLLYDAFEKRRKTVEIMKHTSGGTWVEEEVERYVLTSTFLSHTKTHPFPLQLRSSTQENRRNRRRLCKSQSTGLCQR